MWCFYTNLDLYLASIPDEPTIASLATLQAHATMIIHQAPLKQFAHLKIGAIYHV